MRHSITATADAYTCSHCRQRWGREPSSSYCPGVPFYRWQTSPSHLLTYSQLRAKHLKPRDRTKPDGCISVKREWCWLYDERQAKARRTCSELQRQALEVARQRQRDKWRCTECGSEPTSLAELKHDFAEPGLCGRCQERLQWEAEQDEEEYQRQNDHNEAILWAQALLTRNDWCVLDTETTSLDGYVLDLAIVAPDGAVLFDRLINPEYAVSPGARAVHGISDEELAVAPTLPQVWADLQAALAGRSLILTYNAAFDEGVMLRSARRYQLADLTQKWECIMEWYAQYFGEYSNYWGNYKWQPLNGDHRALGDALAALECLKDMAQTKLAGGDDE